MPYNRSLSIAYAHQWAYSRNPAHYNFDKVGGDCTNFISQCLYAGCKIMNYTADTGWYYKSSNNRSAAWSGVEYLYRFLTANKGPGPYGAEAHISYIQPGDIIQLSFDGLAFAHSLFVVDTVSEIRVATHSQDSDNRPLKTYNYQTARFIHVENVRN